jgi:hypothetical protein
MRYLLVVLLTGCTGIVMQPTESSPAPVCRISCSSGRWLSRPQHICVGSTFFEDATATGRIVTRNVDGTVDTDVYTTRSGDFPTEDTVRGTCQSVIQMRVLSREPDQRGVHPGEVDPARPDHP